MGSTGVLGLTAHASLPAKLLLLLMLASSVVSWAIIGQKLIELRRSRRQSATFLELFRSNLEPALIYRQVRGLRVSPLAGLFCAAYEHLLSRGGRRGGWTGAREDLWKLLEAMAEQQMGRLERYVPFLGTVANVSPFIGLLGTVWGIMVAFFDIGLQGSASLAVVAPGMAEALSATVVGLGAAIPAVVAFNYFTSRLVAVQREVDRFAAELAADLMADHEVRTA
jgi:biopolymer transport protein TolQ